MRLSEVGALVNELGGLSDKAERRSLQNQRRKSGLVELAKSPDQKNWKNRQSIGNVVSTERQVPEGQLPVIVEGKCYPRKTLESSEISRLLDDETAASDSPELGPPPIAHFDVAEPINFAPVPTPMNSTAQTLDVRVGHRDDIKPLPEHLERRRRRESALMGNMSSFPSSNIESANPVAQSMSLKTGAKRKLDVREDGYREVSEQSKLDDFAFQKQSYASEALQARPRGSRFTKSSTLQTSSMAVEIGSTANLESGNRTVLAPKSTNSPSKSRRTVTSDKAYSHKGEVTTRARGQERLEHANVGVGVAEPCLTSDAAEVEEIIVSQGQTGAEPIPKTPAGFDLLSPVSTEPTMQAGQQTEVALTASVEDVLSGVDGRTSRRERGTVSYAEPSLRAKMRRPTKELAPAVGEQVNGFKAQPRKSSAKAERQSPQIGSDLVAKTRTVTIKRERFNDESSDWKPLPEARQEPASPLFNKKVNSSSRESPTDPEPQPPRSSNRGRDSTSELEAGLGGLAIFDGPESSPHDSPQSSVVQLTKTSRRHSSHPTSMRRVGQEIQKPIVPSSRPRHKNDKAPVTDRPPRPQSAAGLCKDNPGENGKMDLRRSASVTALKPPAVSTVEPGGVMSGTAGGGRTERAAARRRSMMT